MRLIFAITLTVFLASCNPNRPNQKKTDRITETSTQGDTASNSGNGSTGQTGGSSGTGNTNQGGGNSGTGNGSTGQGGETPNTGTDTQQPISVDLDELLGHYGITRGILTAYEAASSLKEKIEADKNFKDMVFKTVEVMSYDDEKGLFMVKTEITKNGTSSSQEFTFENFTHPLEGTTLDSVMKSDLKLDEGIENNFTADKFVEEANKKIENFFNEGLKFKSTSNSAGYFREIELGTHKSYSLNATLAIADNSVAEENKRIKITPEYKIIYHKQLSPEAGDSVIKDDLVNEIKQFGEDLIKPYFDQDGVFKYILDQTDETIIKVDSARYASEFYTHVNVSGTAVAGLFNTEDKIKKYAQRYGNGGGHLQINDIDIGIKEPRNGGINADDYEGTLTVAYYIATKEIIGNGGTGVKNVKEMTVGNFKRIDKTNLDIVKELFKFELTRKMPDEDTWTALATFKDGKRLLFKTDGVNPGEEKWYTIDIEVIKTINNKGYDLLLNTSNIELSSFLLKDKDGASLLVENIMLIKQPGQRSLTVEMQFKSTSGTTMEWDIKPIN